MQKDTIVTAFSSVTLDPTNTNIAIPVDGIVSTEIMLASGETVVIPGGYLDIGLHDSMADLFVNLVGAGRILHHRLHLREKPRPARRASPPTSFPGCATAPSRTAPLRRSTALTENSERRSTGQAFWKPWDARSCGASCLYWRLLSGESALLVLTCRMVWSCVFIVLLCSFVKRTRFLVPDARPAGAGHLRHVGRPDVGELGRLHLGGQQRASCSKPASATICVRCSISCSA